MVSISFHSSNLFLKTCKDEGFLTSSGNKSHILARKFDIVSFSKNGVLMFLEAKWVGTAPQVVVFTFLKVKNIFYNIWGMVSFNFKISVKR